jgi:hypothetical protein
MWAIDVLEDAGILPDVISPDITPEFLSLFDALIWNPIVQSAGFILYSVAERFTTAQRFLPRRDPLILDLDGDGIETVGVDPNNPILFDHDGDGVKNGTGWVLPDDGFLVLDRNGNGVIDNGTELFGES